MTTERQDSQGNQCKFHNSDVVKYKLIAITCRNHELNIDNTLNIQLTYTLDKGYLFYLFICMCQLMEKNKSFSYFLTDKQLQELMK